MVVVAFDSPPDVTDLADLAVRAGLLSTAFIKLVIFDMYLDNR